MCESILLIGQFNIWEDFDSLAQASGDSCVTDSDPIDSGVTVWDSALVMAHFLCKNPQEIRGKHRKQIRTIMH